MEQCKEYALKLIDLLHINETFSKNASEQYYWYSSDVIVEVNKMLLFFSFVDII